MKISELVAEIKFDVDTQKLTDFMSVLDSIDKILQSISSRFESVSNSTGSFGRSIDGLKQNAVSQVNEEEAQKNNKESSSNNFKNAIKSFKSTIAFFFGTIKAFSSIINKIKPSIERAFQYQNFGYVTGLDVDRLSNLQNIIQRGGTGLTDKQVANDIANLQQSLMAIKFGQGNIAPYKMLGLSAYYRDPFEVLEDLRESIKNLDNATASYFMKQIGLSHPDWIRFLREDIQGRPWDSFTKPTAGEREDTAALGVSAKRLSTALKDLGDRVVALLSGPASLLLDVLSQFIDLLNMCLSPLRYISYALGSLHGMIDVAGIWIGEAVAKVVQAFDKIIQWVSDKLHLNLSEETTKNVWDSMMINGTIPLYGSGGFPYGAGGFSQTNNISVLKSDDVPKVIDGLTNNNRRMFDNGNTYVQGNFV